MTSKKAQEMKAALYDTFMDVDVDTLQSIYDEINSWDGTFSECGIERYTIADIEDLDMLKSFINGLQYYRSDDNPLQYDYFTIDNYGEWGVWDYNALYTHLDDLIEYLIGNAGYSGFPTWAMDGFTLVFNGYEVDDKERFCKIIQDHI